jgi:hypothetical protein
VTLGRRGQIAAWLLAGGVLFWVTVNLALITLPSWLPHLQDDAEVHFDRAFAPWPGRVVVRNLRLVVHDSSIEMEIAIDDVSADLDLWALLGKRLRFTAADVAGVWFRLRATRPLDELCEKVQRLPPIGDQARPRWLSGVDCAAQPETAGSPGGALPRDLWRVSLGEVRARRIREVWIEEVRLSGELEAFGRFAFWPTVSLEIGPSTLRAAETSLEIDGTDVVRGISARGAAALPKVRLVDVVLWRALSAQLAFTASLADGSALLRYAGGPPLREVAITAGVQGTLSLRDAKFAPGSRLGLERLKITGRGSPRIEARGEATWASSAGGRDARLGVRFSDATLLFGGRSSAELSGRGITASIHYRQAGITSAPDLIAAEVDLPEVDLRSATLGVPGLSIPMAYGRFGLTVQRRGPGAPLAGSLHGSIPEIDLELGEEHLTGASTFRAEVHRRAIGGPFTLQGVLPVELRRGDQSTHGRVDLASLQLATDPLHLTAELRAQVDAVAPLAGLLAAATSVPEPAIPKGRAEGWLDLSLRPGRLEVQRLEGRAELVDLEGAFTSKPGQVDGGLLITVAGIRAALLFEGDTTDLELISATERYYQQQRARRNEARENVPGG